MQSVLRSLRVLEAVSELQPIGVSELARTVGLPTSTTQRIMVTLGEAGWLRQTTDDTGRWTVTAKALVIGRRAIGEVGLREAAVGPMSRLRDLTQETINLSAVDGTERLVMIERADSDQAVRTFLPLGGQSPLHASSSGRAVLAAFPDDVVEQVIRRGLVALTDRTTSTSARTGREWPRSVPRCCPGRARRWPACPFRCRTAGSPASGHPSGVPW
jgi:IclR family acetate operon transcriptional repressor